MPNLEKNTFKAILQGGSSSPEENRLDTTKLSDPVVNHYANVLPEDEQLALGHELARAFSDKDVHPVFIFGSRNSGKTAFLVSMLNYIQTAKYAGATLTLAADELLPEGQLRTDATNIFHRMVHNYDNGTAPNATTVQIPFFVPVRLELLTGEVAYFAFLEGQGEWYQAEMQADVPYKKFKGLLTGVLEQFNKPATVIYIAPYVKDDEVRDANQKQINDANDKGLKGVIEQYRQCRQGLYHRDYHLFVLTKWDVRCQGIAVEDFVDPDPQDVAEVLQQRYKAAWLAYKNMHFAGREAAKTYSVYCAGIFDGARRRATAEADLDKVEYYPRKIWDRLYQNHLGVVLYPDMQPPKISWLDRLLAWFRR